MSTLPNDPFLWTALMHRRRTRSKAFVMAALLVWAVLLALVVGR